MRLRSVLVAALAAAAGGWSMDHTAAADGSDSGWVTLKISRAQVKPRKIDGSPWDPGDKAKANSCGPIGVIGKAVAGPVAGAFATLLCSQSARSQRDRDPSAPDLFVQIAAGDTKFLTTSALDTFAEAFDFSMVVPLDGIPAAGLEFQVLDQDNDIGSGELIGLARLTRRQIQDALKAGTPLLVLSDSQVDKLEIEVSRYTASPPVKAARFAVNQEPTAVAGRARAGELVTIHALGQYSVVNDRSELIDQRGYTNGQKRGYNRDHFSQADHAAAIAYVGAPAASHTRLVVGSCVTAVTPTPGQLYVGVNDEYVSNNQGTLVFDVEFTLPTLEQWRAGGAFACPAVAAPRTAEAPPKDNGSADLPAMLDRAMIVSSVQQVKADIAACSSKSSAKGTVAVSVTVGSKGDVTSISIKSAPDAVLGNCVAAEMRKAVFPPTKTGGSFSYPFIF